MRSKPEFLSEDGLPNQAAPQRSMRRCGWIRSPMKSTDPRVICDTEHAQSTPLSILSRP